MRSAAPRGRAFSGPLFVKTLTGKTITLGVVQPPVAEVATRSRAGGVHQSISGSSSPKQLEDNNAHDAGHRAAGTLHLVLRLGDRTGCFAGTTPVAMADGSTRPIAQLRKGDLVRSWDMRAGKHCAGL